MRTRSGALFASIAASALFAVASPANAEGFGYCWGTKGSTLLYMTPLFRYDGPESNHNAIFRRVLPEWNKYVEAKNLASSLSNKSCFVTSKEIAEREHLKEPARFEETREVSFYPRGLNLTYYVVDKHKNPTPDAITQEEDSAVENAAPEEAAQTREQREAEWQAELDEYAAEKAAWEATIEAQKRAEERKKAEHEARQEKAAEAKAAHEAKMEAHRRRLAETERAREEWLAVKRRHDRCMGGDRQACEDMAAGKPASVEQFADAGQASTDKGPLMGFWGKTCEAARRSATSGAGSVAGNIFDEVRAIPQANGTCLVQGYRYGGNRREGGASRQ